MAELDFAADFAALYGDCVCVADLRLRIEKVIQPAHRCAAALKDVGHKSECDHRKNQARHERIKRDQLAERNPVQNHLAPALPQYEDKCQTEEQLEQRHEQAPEVDEPQVAVDILAVRSVEPASLSFILSLGADNPHAGQIFLRLRGKDRERSLNFSI